MSDPSLAWASIDVSGPMNRSWPSRYEEKRTPSSSIDRMRLSPLPRLRLISSATDPWPIENTWKPPESVMIGRRQAMNSCRPPISATWSSPGVMNRWKVLPSTIGKPRSATSAECRPLTVPLVASGTNAGVGTSPWWVWMRPARLWPSRASMVKVVCSGTRPEPSEGLPLGRGALDGDLAVAVAVAVAVRACSADLDPARLALLGLGDRHRQDAAVEGRGDRVWVDALGQRQRAAERAERALDAVPAALARFVLGLALPADRQGVVAHLER